MSSDQFQKWLALLDEPRTLGSLIMEAYGDAVWRGCMFELQVADLLNWYCRAEPGEIGGFRTRDEEEGEGRQTISGLIKEIENRKFVSDGISVLKDAADARHELVHRLVERNEVNTQTDQQLLLSQILDLRRRIIIGYEFAKAGKMFYAKKIEEEFELPDDFFEKIIQRQKAEAEAADEDVSEALKFLAEKMKQYEPSPPDDTGPPPS